MVKIAIAPGVEMFDELTIEVHELRKKVEKLEEEVAYLKLSPYERLRLDPK